MSRNTSPGLCARASMNPQPHAAGDAPQQQDFQQEGPGSSTRGGPQQQQRGVESPLLATDQRISDSTEQSIDASNQDVRYVPVIRTQRTDVHPQPGPRSAAQVSQTIQVSRTFSRDTKQEVEPRIVVFGTPVSPRSGGQQIAEGGHPIVRFKESDQNPHAQGRERQPGT